MKDHCSNGRSPEPAEPHAHPRFAGLAPDVSFSFTLEGNRSSSGEDGLLIDAVHYDAFGNCLDGCGLQPYELDEEALLHASNRSFDPTPGSWMQEGAIRFAAADVNLARYVQGNATDAADRNSV
jgi:hypothetical protein